jgi:hypothetical protein
VEGRLDFDRCWKYLYHAPTCDVFGMENSDDGRHVKLVIKGKCWQGLTTAHNDYLCRPESSEKVRNYIGSGFVHLDD